ncbi:hypothetical protein NTGBS_140001 [Candidatus Nitrotoga sp. BS]|uniref:hypothetical protein n=1 Tax=Candidatus Nitrotoga sp. BS TaxID=2890408 RepID=UPI001EF361EE|nr:hypothetical protein [Candidatus Nitrotoga sp. BS]CAH1192168.1 hypothetical protein NTGBS_140001 [Candidatus Nitrotoga sp. BS]
MFKILNAPAKAGGFYHLIENKNKNNSKHSARLAFIDSEYDCALTAEQFQKRLED